MLLTMLRIPEPEQLTCQPTLVLFPHLLGEELKVISKNPPGSEMLGVQPLHCK